MEEQVKKLSEQMEQINKNICHIAGGIALILDHMADEAGISDIERLSFDLAATSLTKIHEQAVKKDVNDGEFEKIGKIIRSVANEIFDMNTGNFKP